VHGPRTPASLVAVTARPEH